MISVAPMAPEDRASIPLRPADAWVLEQDTIVSGAWDYAAYSFVDDDFQPVALGGVSLEDGVAEVWFCGSARLPQHARSVFAYLKRHLPLLLEQDIHLVKAVVNVQDAAAVRWAERLGFTFQEHLEGNLSIYVMEG